MTTKIHTQTYNNAQAERELTRVSVWVPIRDKHSIKASADRYCEIFARENKPKGE